MKPCCFVTHGFLVASSLQEPKFHETGMAAHAGTVVRIDQQRSCWLVTLAEDLVHGKMPSDLYGVASGHGE